MSDSLIDLIEPVNPLAFILNNGIKNENGSPIEFGDHYFMIDPFMDMTERQVELKCSQIGGSTKNIVKAFHLAKYMQANVIYTLPTRNAVRDFVIPKVNPIIKHNPKFQEFVGSTDSIELKSVGDRFVYFRGSWGQESAISISAHILINDERDRSNPKTLETYKTRLDDAKRERPDLGFEWEFSNPTIPGAGVDELWQESDQKHWFVKCPHCRHEWYLTYPENIDFEKQEYVCTKCHGVLDREARRTGRWVNKRESDVSGYWYSQMFVPWIPAAKIIRDSKKDQSIFHNFTLGLPYISKEYGITRSDIIQNISPDSHTEEGVAMGVDNGVIKTVVIGNKKGIFKVYETDSWERIEEDRNRYGAYMVIDANPYPNTPTKLAKKYRGKVYIHYFVQDTKNLGIIDWSKGDDWGVVESDRTKIIDDVVATIHSKDVTYLMTSSALEQYISDCTQMYRVVEQNAKGFSVARWKTKGEDAGAKKRDHYFFATIYWRIALEKTLVSGGIVKPPSPKKEVEHPVVSPDGTVPAIDMKDVLARASKKKKDWRTS